MDLQKEKGKLPAGDPLQVILLCAACLLSRRIERNPHHLTSGKKTCMQGRRRQLWGLKKAERGTWNIFKRTETGKSGE